MMDMIPFLVLDLFQSFYTVGERMNSNKTGGHPFALAFDRTDSNTHLTENDGGKGDNYQVQRCSYVYNSNANGVR